MHRGYVKLWRKSIEGGWLTNPKLWAFWCYCLMKASHKQCKVVIGFKEVILEPGQFVFGRKQTSKDIRLSEQSVRTCLQTLKSTNNITIKPTNKFSIISIVNWETYQSEEEEINQQINHQDNIQLTNNQPTTNHIQECKTHKNENKKKESVIIPNWIPKDLWQDFKEYRIRIKAPLTDRALKNIIAKLERLKSEGQDPVAVINEAITRGWRGVFAIQPQGFKPIEKPSGSATPPDRLDKLLKAQQEREKYLKGDGK